MVKNDKKGLRARLDDIYKWSVKSGVAVVTPNSLKVQWDKVIEELNETLLHVRYDDREKLVDDIGDTFISFVNLLNMDPRKKKGVFKQNVERMDRVAHTIKSLSKMQGWVIPSYKSFLLEVIFETIKEAHTLKRKTAQESDLFKFMGQLISIYSHVNKHFKLKTSLKSCIYASYLEIQNRRYEIRVR